MVSKDSIAEIELFDGLSDRQISGIAESAKQIEIAAGELVFREGAEAEYLYVLLSGEVAIQINLSSRPETVTVSLIQIAHQSFGWSGVVAPYRYSAHATAKANSRLLAIPGKALLKLLRLEPATGFDVLLRISEVISQRLHNSRAALLRTL
jgi:CRP-like cAMP-binding protein